MLRLSTQKKKKNPLLVTLINKLVSFTQMCIVCTLYSQWKGSYGALSSCSISFATALTLLDAEAANFDKSKPSTSTSSQPYIRVGGAERNREERYCEQKRRPVMRSEEGGKLYRVVCENEMSQRHQPVAPNKTEGKSK